MIQIAVVCLGFFLGVMSLRTINSAEVSISKEKKLTGKAAVGIGIGLMYLAVGLFWFSAFGVQLVMDWYAGKSPYVSYFGKSDLDVPVLSVILWSIPVIVACLLTFRIFSRLERPRAAWGIAPAIAVAWLLVLVCLLKSWWWVTSMSTGSFVAVAGSSMVVTSAGYLWYRKRKKPAETSVPRTSE